MKRGTKTIISPRGAGQDMFGLFQKSRNTTGRAGGVKTRGPVKGGKK